MTRARTLAVAVLLVASAVLMPARVLAQRAAPSMQATATFDPPAAAIGDKVTLTIRVTHPDDVILKATPPNLQDVDLLTTVPSAMTPGTTARTQVTTFEYTLQPFLLGTLDTGSIRLSWLRANGSTGTTDIAGAKLVVTPVRAASDQALRPFKAQVSIAGAPPAWVRPAIAVGALVLLAVVAWVIAFLVRRRRAGTTEAVGPRDTSAEGAARDALDAIGVRGPRAHGLTSIDYGEYYGGIALTVRTYLAARFGFNAHALTTTELERRMVANGVDRWQARLVGGLLERCDDAVYAHRVPEAASADHDLTVAYEIVELSRPREPEGGEAALA